MYFVERYSQMINLQRILCPTDLSSESDEALRYAVALTSAYQAKLVLFYCRKVRSPGKNDEAKESNIQRESMFTASLAAHLGLNEFGNLDWEGVLAKNVEDVGKAIVDEAAKQKVDLIVLRSRRRPRAAILLGSTAETVCRTAHCPVLVTHPSEREWVGFSTGEIDLRRILVAYDFSPDAEVALNYGLSLAQEYQTELHLLHVLPKAEEEDPELAWFRKADGEYTDAARKLHGAIPREAFLWCKIFSAVCWGKAYQEVLTYATEHDIDLICLGASGSDFTLDTLFGSNVDRILRQAPCPVLIARPVKPSNSVTSMQQAVQAGNQL
jgi:nucleotide-binding universal stress UspA family protein